MTSVYAFLHYIVISQQLNDHSKYPQSLDQPEKYSRLSPQLLQPTDPYKPGKSDKWKTTCQYTYD